MNAVGKLGELIIRYQLGIEIGLLMILGVIVLVWLIRLVRRASAQKTVLKEIDEKVNDISEAVEGLSAKLEAVGTEAGAAAVTKAVATEAALVATTEDVTEPTADVAETAKVAAAATETVDTAKATATEAATEPAPTTEAETTKDNPSLRYYTRDWGVDKHGNVYTEEMLREQIG